MVEKKENRKSLQIATSNFLISNGPANLLLPIVSNPKMSLPLKNCKISKNKNV